MTIRRRMMPLLTVGVLAALTAGAAVVGVLGSPSPEQSSLQNAAEQTAEAPSFSYTLSNQIGSARPVLPAVTVRVHGVWLSPDQWRVRDVLGGATAVTTVTGSVLHVTDDDGPSVTFRLPSSSVGVSLTDPDSPVLTLPPLGLLFAATNITRTGDRYSFIVPRLIIGVSGWVAFAPLSHATVPLALTVAFETRADAVVKDGFVVSFTFPDGIRPRRGAALRLADWHLSDFGTATLRGAAAST